jgi:hypothetical protein
MLDSQENQVYQDSQGCDSLCKKFRRGLVTPNCSQDRRDRKCRITLSDKSTA